MPSPAAELEVDCLAAGVVGGLAAALLDGRDRDLLAPLRFLAPGAMPTGAPPRVERAALARGLGVANASYGHPRAAELARKLADPATRVVATGQQTGLLGGPLLGWVKAAAAVRWAEALEARGEPAVAVFWMATEDHDWTEVARAAFPAGRGGRELRRFSLGADPQPLAPVGLRTVGAGIEPILAELEALHPQPWARPALDRLRSLWRPEARFGEAFARQLVAAFGGRAPLLLDALLPELKAAERPHLAHLVERRAELERAFAERERALAGRGYAPQVAPQPGASPLFLLRGGERRRIEWRGEAEWALRGEGRAARPRPIAELLETIDDNPAAVSPGALARPAVQDAVLGTTLQVMGPGELAYLAQAAAVHELLVAAPPWSSARPSALVLDRGARERLSALGLGLGELIADPAAAERRLGATRGGGFVGPARDEILARLDALAEPALEADPALERARRKTRRTVAWALDKLDAKVARAAARRDAETHDRFAALVARVRPEGALQERVVCAAHFELRHGDGFGTALLDGLGLDPRRLSIVDPEPAGARAEAREPLARAAGEEGTR